jgi:hypothetical protein
MMKVKIFADSNYTVLEEQINAFTKDKTVIDIKFTTSKYTTKALVMYLE